MHVLIAWKRDPEIKRDRQQLADFFRSTRRKNPALARLIYQRIKAAKAKMNALTWEN